VSSKAELSEGDVAPDFALPSSSGKDVRLSSLRGKSVVLYFYPQDDTSGCTKEACSFRDNMPNFDKLNATILGVSKDSLDSHNNFIKKYSLNFVSTLYSSATRLSRFTSYTTRGERRRCTEGNIGELNVPRSSSGKMGRY
jgi:peroxiredoxin